MLLQQSRQEKNFWVKVREDSNLWHSNIGINCLLSWEGTLFLSEKDKWVDLAKESNFK